MALDKERVQESDAIVLMALLMSIIPWIWAGCGRGSPIPVVELQDNCLS